MAEAGSAGIEVECDESQPLALPPEYKYVYFNQHIQQIPGYNPEQDQILIRVGGSLNNSLLWYTPVCIEVLSCLRLVNKEDGSVVLEAEKNRVKVLQVQDYNVTPCQIELAQTEAVSCITQTQNELVIDRKAFLTLKPFEEIDPQETCDPIPLENCPQNE